MPTKQIQALFNAEQYHGWNRKKRYFEGWYYKVVNAAEDKSFAFIPGISMDEQGKQQAFIQILDGRKRTAKYHKFASSDFVPTPGEFKIGISNNTFTKDYIELNLPDAKGKLTFSNQTPWPNPWYSPNIMGPFSFVPFMQCYHGILSMDHQVDGQLMLNGETIDFSGGRGYMEKDWGSSFPAAYIWMQTNHFSESGISLKASVAKIPWMGTSFVGFIAGLWLHDRLYQFTTYNFTRLIKSHADRKTVQVVLENRKHRLTINAKRDATTVLASPILGFMDGRIEESMTAKIRISLLDKNTNNIIFEDTGRNAGLEVAGNIPEILVG